MPLIQVHTSDGEMFNISNPNKIAKVNAIPPTKATTVRTHPATLSIFLSYAFSARIIDMASVWRSCCVVKGHMNKPQIILLFCCLEPRIVELGIAPADHCFASIVAFAPFAAATCVVVDTTYPLGFPW